MQWIQDRIDKDILNTTSADLLLEAQGTLRSEIDDYFKAKRQESKIYNKIKGGYSTFLKSSYQRTHKGLAKARLTDLKPKFRKELEKRVALSFNLIKNKDNEVKQELASRFLNWITIDSKEVRGDSTSKQSLLNFLDFAKEAGVAQRHSRFVIEDQTRKMLASFDDLIAKENGAIGGFWKNRKDKRVVGNPKGLYPKGNRAHNDHWNREDQFYILKNSWAYKQKLVTGNIYEDLEDGGVGVAIGCRCRLVYVYDLRDVPYEHLTKKGKEAIYGR